MRIHRQRHLCGLLLPGFQHRRSHGFVELQIQPQPGALHRAGAAGILGAFFRKVGPGGIRQAHIRPLEFGILEDLHRKIEGPFPIVIDAVTEILLYVRHAAAEDRIVEASDQQLPPLRFRCIAGHQLHGGRHRSGKAHHHQQAAPLLQSGVAGGHFDSVRQLHATLRGCQNRTDRRGGRQQKNSGASPGGQQTDSLHRIHRPGAHQQLPVVIQSVLDGFLEQTLLDEGGCVLRIDFHSGQQPAIQGGMTGFNAAGEGAVIGFGKTPQG